MEKKTLDEYVKTFTSCFKKLCKKEMENGEEKEGDGLKREARLLDIRYRLTLDLRVGIETKYSSTKTKSVKDVYELLFKFMDLWNVYEVCHKYGHDLGVCDGSKYKGWKKDISEFGEIKKFLEKAESEFKKLFLKNKKDKNLYKEYLEHFEGLPVNTKKNDSQKYIALSVDGFDYEQLLFIQYMERNAFYHGGEAARSGVNYAYRKRQLQFYIEFLTQFIALLGARLFTIDMTKQ